MCFGFRWFYSLSVGPYNICRGEFHTFYRILPFVMCPLSPCLFLFPVTVVNEALYFTCSFNLLTWRTWRTDLVQFQLRSCTGEVRTQITTVVAALYVKLSAPETHQIHLVFPQLPSLPSGRFLSYK
jgi:hypothetical protein